MQSYNCPKKRHSVLIGNHIGYRTSNKNTSDLYFEALDNKMTGHGVELLEQGRRRSKQKKLYSKRCTVNYHLWPDRMLVLYELRLYEDELEAEGMAKSVCYWFVSCWNHLYKVWLKKIILRSLGRADPIVLSTIW